VYASIFRCGRRRVADYAHLEAWMRDVHQLRIPGGGLQVRCGWVGGWVGEEVGGWGGRGQRTFD